ncbi:alpha/beta hydrolase [Coraliomargarita algicola]|uniref:Alpha/beta hydrolase n=1 Tax=Coraliomargarita algicola TaxID=3092156 RepID=A0ABZ0RP46_9BACT|nr:alpha/beta hydrolase [Coraliomargarita sp. J2-16]WPJ96745.1 alpha/beta hydrolase [Coraliomargarita sp. J2-16]
MPRPLITCAYLCLISIAHIGFALSSGPQPDQTRVYKTIGEKDFELHIFYPKGHQPAEARAAIVFFHGGAWNSGDPNRFYPQCQYLAERGMVAISAKYRLRGSDGTSPAECVTDAKSAIRWVRSHASALGVDPNRIAAGGGSAGGQMAAATATATGFNDPSDDLSIDCRPNALVLFNPVIDNGPGPNAFAHNRVVKYWKDFSPLHNISENTPPTIILVGSEDGASKPAACEAFQQRMQENGRRCDLLIYEGQTHGFYFKKPKYRPITKEVMAQFLLSIGFIENRDNAMPQ